jgi:antitoxin component YwqK of YwqJK toxin-antitoxin module
VTRRVLFGIAWLVAGCQASSDRGSGNEFVRVDHPNGRIASLETWTGDTITGLCVYWRDDGSLESIEFRRDLQFEGPRLEFFEGGKLSIASFWKKTSLHGPYRKWHRSGDLALDVGFVDGALHGAYLQYNASGVLIVEDHFERGLRHGNYRVWNDQGVLVEQGQHLNGKAVGVWTKLFDDAHSVRRRIEYRDGRRWNDEARCAPDDEMTVMMVDGTALQPPDLHCPP